MPRRSLLILLAALLCAAALATVLIAASVTGDRVRAARPLPFEPSEQLVYTGSFSRLLLRDIDIAELRFTVNRMPTPATAKEGASDPSANLLFTGEVDSKGWFRKLFGIHFHYHFESTVEPDSFASLRAKEFDEQGERQRESETIFDHLANSSTWTERDPKNPARGTRVVTLPQSGTAHDLLSAIYYLRAQPLAPGANLELFISESGHAYHIPVKVVERKKLSTVLGKVPTLRVDIEMFGDKGLIRGSGQMSLWLTDDARRIPVRAHISSSMGTLNIALKSATRAAGE